MTGRKSRFDYAKETLQPEKIEEKAKPELLAESKHITKKSTPAKKAPPSKPEEKTVIPDLAVAAQAAMQNPAAFALPPQRRGWRGNRGEDVVKRMDVPREQLNVRVRPELKRAAAARAALSGLTLGDVVEAALIAYLDAANK